MMNGALSSTGFKLLIVSTLERSIAGLIRHSTRPGTARPLAVTLRAGGQLSLTSLEFPEDLKEQKGPAL